MKYESAAAMVWLRTRPPLEVDFCVVWALGTETLAGADLYMSFAYSDAFMQRRTSHVARCSVLKPPGLLQSSNLKLVYVLAR